MVRCSCNFLLVAVFMSTGVLTHAQQADTIRKNTIKLDLTSYWLYRNAAIFSYERLARPHQTWVVTAGFQQFPPLSSLDSINVTRSTNARGFKLGIEYRFYLQKENRYNPPHGIYIGPYLAFHNFHNTRHLEVNNNGTLEEAELSLDINILNPGVQVGYQFLIKNRWTIDLVFIGPSLSNYRAKAKLDGNFSFDGDQITDDVLLALMDRFPILDELITDQEATVDGRLNTWAMGFRYQIHVGYHFGRKTKK